MIGKLKGEQDGEAAFARVMDYQGLSAGTRPFHCRLDGRTFSRLFG